MNVFILIRFDQVFMCHYIKNSSRPIHVKHVPLRWTWKRQFTKNLVSEIWCDICFFKINLYLLILVIFKFYLAITQ